MLNQSSGVFGLTPDGIDLNETQSTAILSAVISLMVIATIFVVLRVVMRTIQKGTVLAVDDYCIEMGLVSLAQIKPIPTNENEVFRPWYSCLLSH